MAAYMIVDNEVTDAEGFREYQRRVGSTAPSQTLITSRQKSCFDDAKMAAVLEAQGKAPPLIRFLER